MISPCIEKELPLQASHSEKCTPHCLGLCKSGSFKQYFGHCSCLMLQCEISPEAVKRPPVFRRIAWYIVCSKHFLCLFPAIYTWYFCTFCRLYNFAPTFNRRHWNLPGVATAVIGFHWRCCAPGSIDLAAGIGKLGRCELR